LIKRLLSIKERSLPANPAQIAVSQSDLALVFQAKGNFKSAETYLKNALSAQEKSLPADSEETATTIYRLAYLYSSFGRWKESEGHWRRLLQQKEKLHGPEAPQVCECIYNLALCTFKAGRNDESEALWERLKDLSPNLRDVAYATHYLAELARVKGDNVKAEELYLKAIDLKTKAFGGSHSEVAQSLECYATLLAKTFRDDAAEHMRSCAKAILRSAQLTASGQVAVQ
jgi:tetratricopeptide (TPR) repeat protein